MSAERSVALQGLVGAALLAGLIYLLSPILTPFVAAIILAYLFAPLTDWMCARRVPRPLAALLVMLLLVAGLVLLAVLLLPPLQREIWMFLNRLPTFFDAVRLKLLPFLHDTLGVDMRWDGASIRDLISSQLQTGSGGVAGAVLPWLGGGSAVLLGLLMNAVLMPLVLYYLLRDWKQILASLEEMVPRRHNRMVMQLATEANGVLAEFLRGQITVMVVMSVFYVTGLWLAGLEFALPIGMVTGMLVFIPYVGVITGLLLATLASAGQFTAWGGVLGVWAVFAIGHALESFAVTPRLVGERIGLHPVAVIFALLAFGQLFGFFGVLLALPMSAVLLVGMRHVKAWYLSSQLYRE